MEIMQPKEKCWLSFGKPFEMVYVFEYNNNVNVNMVRIHVFL
jgi:hypothetical protein